MFEPQYVKIQEVEKNLAPFKSVQMDTWTLFPNDWIKPWILQSIFSLLLNL